jgi:ribosome maturation factor RimP
MASPRTVLLDGLSEPLAELGVDLEDVEVAKAGRRHVVRVIIDRDGGVDLDLVAKVSQRISELLDGPLDDAIEGAYVLEVTSPGVDRPLTLPRHWRRALTRLVQVTLADGSEVTGRISEVTDDETVVLTLDGEQRSLSLADVTRAIVQVEFNRKDDPASGSDGEE